MKLTTILNICPENWSDLSDLIIGVHGYQNNLRYIAKPDDFIQAARKGEAIAEKIGIKPTNRTGLILDAISGGTEFNKTNYTKKCIIRTRYLIKRGQKGYWYITDAWEYNQYPGKALRDNDCELLITQKMADKVLKDMQLRIHEEIKNLEV